MGSVCSGGAGRRDSVYAAPPKSDEFSGKLKSVKSFDHKHQEEDPVSSFSGIDHYRRNPHYYDSCELGLQPGLKPSTPARTVVAKVPQVGSLLGRAGIVSLERAVEVLDTLGSRANLLQSLSENNILLLKEEILHSEGVQRLVSTDMEELLRIAAADKRDEFNVFTKEVIRFGDKCKDPQWHNLDRYFKKLDSDVTVHKLVREEAELTVQELATLAQHTAELYHELHALDRFEQDYQRKLEEVESLHLPRRGEGLVILHSELKNQRKLVRSLQKKSLWSKSLEEVMEKFVDVVAFIHQEMLEAFGNSGTTIIKESNRNVQRLGVSGLALHYANIINQIDNIVSRPSSLPPNVRDTLYHGLPSGVKAALRSRLQLKCSKEELTVAQIKAEMEKTLQWLVPVATNTTKLFSLLVFLVSSMYIFIFMLCFRAHQGFGWVGEWANAGNDFNKKTSAQNSILRLETLYHAEKEKTETYILELVAWLHYLISQVRQRDYGFKPMGPVRSPTQKIMVVPSEAQKDQHLLSNGKANRMPKLSQVDQDMLDDLSSRRSNPGISKSQEFSTKKKRRGINGLTMSKSSGSSPTREFNISEAVEHAKVDALDVIDGLNSTH
ncbi:hypothetical protein Scep_000365 [Stephania cephalantha]|uniref:Uncharacterized protein n=1 Tax=Stephania cephalantha TaxID=152367 RepID=A0AAP0Q429_9MAGN